MTETANLIPVRSRAKLPLRWRLLQAVEGFVNLGGRSLYCCWTESRSLARDRRRMAIDEGWRMVQLQEASWASEKHCKRSIAVSTIIMAIIWGKCAHILIVRPKVQSSQPISHWRVSYSISSTSIIHRLSIRFNQSAFGDSL